MSYLLTEIALEMLGYKFYDTNGIFHLTNFQSQTAQSENQNSDEPSLMDFIEQREPPTPAPQAKSLQNGHCVKEDPDKSTTSLKLEPTIELPSTSTSTSLNRRTPAKALAKIVHYESDKICNQITVRIEKAMQKQNTNFQSALTKCVNEEVQKIKDDATELQKFREFLEDSLRRIDRRPYEKYLRTFGDKD
ncbi:uncharacterized protein Dwil_GK15394 [Drosophila willistoni]|uniref:Uncharacterized protein n=1 Tax=Drosophila willistoni TaxID=7260 RepID=B4MUY0_DROWI|nr:uncharacterized protein LOC6642177 [Drosophila willistoni]EDW76325.1 uncharacterized protein Dwil_GK15394 [Drosophila willistoni]